MPLNAPLDEHVFDTCVTSPAARCVCVRACVLWISYSVRMLFYDRWVRLTHAQTHSHACMRGWLCLQVFIHWERSFLDLISMSNALHTWFILYAAGCVCVLGSDGPPGSSCLCSSCAYTPAWIRLLYRISVYWINEFVTHYINGCEKKALEDRQSSQGSSPN